MNMFGILRRGVVIAAPEYDKNNIIHSLGKGRFIISEIDGSSIHGMQGLLDEISKVMRFPSRSRTWDSLRDWLRDLEWYGEHDGHILFIKNAEDYFAKYPDDAVTFIRVWLSAIESHFKVYKVTMALHLILLTGDYK